MHGLPTPPTDNLYKFVAIAGVALILGSLLVVGIYSKAEIEWFGNTGDRIIQRRHERISSKAITKNEVDDLWKEEVRLFHSLVAERTSVSKYLAPVLGCAIGAGILMTPIGFFLWWWKVQKYQDELLRLEYEKAKLDHNEKMKTAAAPRPA